MKRTATIVFTLVYFISTSGVLMGQHLCMGRVKESAIFQKVITDCGMGMEAHKDMEGCCDDEWSLEKVEDDQQVTAGSDAPKTAYHLLYETPLTELTPALISQADEFDVRNTGPPDIPEPGLFILYQSLKIPFALQS
ncbi:MAG: hypothetical protein HEP71_16250 [Roseivirga sp.]|nr:hypothetical protein [Roseivirga sp.]